VNAHFVCNYDVNFEIQIALLLVVGPEKYHMEYFSKKVFPASEVTEWGAVPVLCRRLGVHGRRDVSGVGLEAVLVSERVHDVGCVGTRRSR
jgi:hypothetical protein